MARPASRSDRRDGKSSVDTKARRRRRLIRRAWRNFLTVGLPFDEWSPLMLRIKFLNFFALSATIFLIIFGLVNVIGGTVSHGLIEMVLALVAAVVLVYFRYTKNVELAITIALINTIAVMVFLILTGGMDKTGILWVFCLPAAVFFTQGKRRGWWWTAFILLGLVILVALSKTGFIEIAYSYIQLRQFTASYLLLSSLMYFYESIRDDYEKIIESKNKEILETNMDLTREFAAREKVQQDLVAATKEAERANRAKSEFLSRMSHELRTPLNAILGFAQLLESDSRDPLTPAQSEKLHFILRSGQDLLMLINEVLDLARIEAGRMVLASQKTPLGPVIQEAVSIIRPLADQRQIVMQDKTGANQGACLTVDPIRLKQVLLNFLSNAVKYNREAGLIAVEAEEVREGILRVSVVDTGMGIPEDKQEMVFEPFLRLGEDDAAVEGTGIGLTIVKKVTEAMGGQVGLTSTPGLGSRFFVEFPLVGRVEAVAVEAEQLAAELKEVPAPTAPAQRTLLYIEDDLANLILVRHILNRRPDIRLLEAPQGQLGLDLASAHRPDVILLDIHLPDMTGRDVLRVLRQDEVTRDVPVVVVSASAMPNEVQRVIDEGASTFLAKPLDVKLFLETLDSLLYGGGQGPAAGGDRPA